MTRLREAGRRTFRSLSVRNYRLYFTAQLISMSGTWMQTIAQDWLVLRLTNSALPVGIATALQFTPMLVIGLWSGLIADRVDKRKLLMITQSTAGALALALGLLTLTGVVQLWMVYLLALGLGIVTAVDNPARQAFVSELVGTEFVANAVSLNSAVFNSARVIGPAIAGVLIATIGMAPAFLANAASYVAVVVALWMMDPTELVRGRPAARAKGQIVAGLRYVWTTPALRLAMLLVTVIATLAMNSRVILPLLARFAFHRGAGTYGTLASALAIGAVAGALVMAARSRPTRRLLLGSAAALGVLSLAAAFAPTLGVEYAVLPPLGFAMIAFSTTANATLQLGARPEMRGRVMALYAFVFLGSTPFGGLLVGWLAEVAGARSGFALAGVAALAAVAVALAAGLVGHRAGTSEVRYAAR